MAHAIARRASGMGPQHLKMRRSVLIGTSLWTHWMLSLALTRKTKSPTAAHSCPCRPTLALLAVVSGDRSITVRTGGVATSIITLATGTNSIVAPSSSSSILSHSRPSRPNPCASRSLCTLFSLFVPFSSYCSACCR